MLVMKMEFRFLMMTMTFGLIIFQGSIQRERDTRDQNMYQLMKTKMVTGCLLVMFHGSKFFFPASPSLCYLFICSNSSCSQGCLCSFQHVHVILQKTENHERIRG